MSTSKITQNLISDDIDNFFADQLKEAFKDIESSEHSINENNITCGLVEELEMPDRTHMDFLFGTSS